MQELVQNFRTNPFGQLIEVSHAVGRELPNHLSVLTYAIHRKPDGGYQLRTEFIGHGKPQELLHPIAGQCSLTWETFRDLCIEARVRVRMGYLVSNVSLELVKWIEAGAVTTPRR